MSNKGKYVNITDEVKEILTNINTSLPEDMLRIRNQYAVNGNWYYDEANHIIFNSFTQSNFTLFANFPVTVTKDTITLNYQLNPFIFNRDLRDSVTCTHQEFKNGQIYILLLTSIINLLDRYSYTMTKQPAITFKNENSRLSYIVCSAVENCIPYNRRLMEYNEYFRQIEEPIIRFSIAKHYPIVSESSIYFLSTYLYDSIPFCINKSVQNVFLSSLKILNNIEKASKMS